MKYEQLYIVGVYWKARTTTTDESAKLIYEILLELQEVSQVFNFWFERVSSNFDSAPEIKIQQSVVLRLVQHYFEDNKHGYSFTAWNKERASVSCLLGATSSYFPNYFIVEFPSTSEAMSIEEMNKVMSIFCRKLNPDYGYASQLEKFLPDHASPPLGVFKVIEA